MIGKLCTGELSHDADHLFFRVTWIALLHCLLFSLSELGVRGDLVSVKKSVGRNRLLPQGLAVYASPENKKLFEEEKLVSSKKGQGNLEL
jgi:hypothetical protein